MENQEITKDEVEKLCKKIAKNLLLNGKPIVVEVRFNTESSSSDKGGALEAIYSEGKEENYFYYVEGFVAEETSLLLIADFATGGYQISSHGVYTSDIFIPNSKPSEHVHVIKKEGKKALIKLLSIYGIRSYNVVIKEIT